MTRTRIDLLSIEESKRIAAEAGLPEAMAELCVFRALLRHPPVARILCDLLLTLLVRGTLDARLRELLIMRIGWATASVYEWTQHWRVARQLGVSEQDLLAVRDWRAHEGWSAAERAVLAATDETLEVGAVSAQTWAECQKTLPEVSDQLELLAAIGTWRMISQILRSLEIPLEDGVAPWPPDGLVPEPAGAASS